MLKTKDVDIYVDNELALKDITLSYEEFELQSEEPQDVTGTAFLPTGDYFSQQKTLVIDFKDGVFAKAIIIASDRLCDEWQSEMRFIDAGESLADMMK